ncbi:MAG: VWA domain-containing protein [Methylococcales bacterium]|nr:VWA domain-containing protein [Methylococcales bacterium]
MNLAEFHFIRPFWLLAIIPAIIMMVFLLKNKLNQGNWNAVCDEALLPFILQEKPAGKSRWVLSTGALASLLTIIALAGPTWERLPSPVFRNDAALVIVLDLSKSMDATDVKPSRLSRARYKIADILKQRKDGQSALLVYAGDAFTVTPLTEDTDTILSQISALNTELMPEQGSNTVLALEKAVGLLKQSGLQTGDILLVSDGISSDDLISEVDSLADYRLSILGVGTAEGAPIKLAGGGFFKDANGNIVIPKLNISQLSALANKGSGWYKTMTDDDSDINALLAQLDSPIEKQGGKDNNLLIDQWDEKGPWLLLLVLPLAALSFRKGLLSITLLLLLPFPEASYALEWDDLWQTQGQQAQQAFKQQNYQQAAEQFTDPQWKAAAQYKAGQFEQAIESLQDDQSATGLYNNGNALAQSGKLQEAKKAYEQSLEKQPDNEDAKYNKEQVEKALEKQNKNQQKGDDKKQSDQKDSKQGDDKQDQQEGSEPSDKKQNSEQNEQSKNSDESEQKAAEDEAKDSEQPQEPKSDQQKEQQQKQQEAEQQQANESEQYDESEQANEQWLKRIPDDPAGLLKRKFKYQYGQRGRKKNNNPAW